jgi:hypothetical protein
MRRGLVCSGRGGLCRPLHVLIWRPVFSAHSLILSTSSWVSRSFVRSYSLAVRGLSWPETCGSRSALAPRNLIGEPEQASTVTANAVVGEVAPPSENRRR